MVKLWDEDKPKKKKKSENRKAEKENDKVNEEEDRSLEAWAKIILGENYGKDPNKENEE